MSYEKRANGRYVVRWRDSAGKPRSKTVYRQADARKLDDDKKHRKLMGTLATDERGGIELRDFYELWWDRHAVPNMSERTRTTYSQLWRVHVSETLGRRRLKSLRREQVITFAAALGKKLAPASVVKVMGLLHNVLERAVEWEYIGTNPAARVKRPRTNHRRGRVVNIAQLERLCAELSHRSESFVRVLAYTGLRPGELRALRWGDVAHAVYVERAASANQIGPTKTNKTRSVELRSDASKALLEWWVASGQLAEHELIFPSPQGGLWSDNGYNMWATRTFRNAASRAGLKGLVPYDLRHTFVSTLIAEGHDLYWIARQCGHSPSMMLETYAHLVESVASERHANDNTPWIRSVHGA